MQEIKREALIEKASELLGSGTVDRVLGWKNGEFVYDVTPGVFASAEEMWAEFVWNDFCGANFSKYLVAETGKTQSKVLAFLKPCDTYSFNQLLTEHRFDREKVYVVGVPCEGMIDGKKLKEKGYMKEGTVMVPLKSVARALGYRVSYNSSAKRYQLKGKLNVCSVEFGSSIYTMRSTNAIGMSAPTDLGSEPMRLNKVTYVPAELFRMLLGNAEGAVTISDKRIDIEK